MINVVYTIGHSNRTLEDLIKILKFLKIEVLVDIRRFPKSRKNPQFNKENLEKILPENKIEYIWIENLGGFRKSGYLNYTKTEEFKNGLKKLMEISKKKLTSIMCAEILWFKCHRRFISNELVKFNFKVFHIYNDKKIYEHNIKVS